MFTETASQGIVPQDVLNAATVTNATAYTLGSVDMSKWKRALYVIQAGTVTGSWAAQLLGCATNNIAATNTAITGTNTGLITSNNLIAILEVRADQLTNLNSTYRFVRATLNTTNATIIGVIGYGVDAVQKPGSQYALNSTFIGATNVCTI